jgi:hypothetical protein
MGIGLCVRWGMSGDVRFDFENWENRMERGKVFVRYGGRNEIWRR